MNLFILVALLCTDNSQCDYVALDNNLSFAQCDSYFTDSGTEVVDGLITDYVTYEAKEPLTLESINCVQEDTE